MTHLRLSPRGVAHVVRSRLSARAACGTAMPSSAEEVERPEFVCRRCRRVVLVDRRLAESSR
jgi:hypothetical protein